jgi:hypothetical protein
LYHTLGERISGNKYDMAMFSAIDKIKNYVDHIDHLVLSGVTKTQKD